MRRGGMVLSERASAGFDDFRLLGDECKCRPAKGGAGESPIVVESNVIANLQIDKMTRWLLVGLLVVSVLRK